MIEKTKPIHSLRRDRLNLYSELKEAAHRWRKTAFPVLTCAIAGHREYDDDDTFLLSRAHQTQTLAAVEALNSMSWQTNMSSMIDIGQYLNFPYHNSLYNKGVLGRLLANDPSLRIGHQIAAPLLRKGANIEPQLEETVNLLFDQPERFIGKPITTFHYAVGNNIAKLLAEKGINNIPVIHFVSDPYVHQEYLIHADKKFIYYFTFDRQTAQELVKKGVPAERVFTIGFPISRHLEIKKSREKIMEECSFEPNKKIRVGIITGGLGGNADQIESIATSLKYEEQQGIFYCSTNRELAAKLYTKLGKKARIVDVSKGDRLIVNEKDEAIIVVGDYLDQDLIKASYDVLNTCSIICTKPSGDIGIEALLANKLIIPLDPWGKHEKNILKIMEKMGAVIPVFDMLTVGADISRLYRRFIFPTDRAYSPHSFISRPMNDLTKRALYLQYHLASVRNPFDWQWEDNLLKALKYIHGKHIPIL